MASENDECNTIWQRDVQEFHSSSLPTETQVASLTVARHLGAVRTQRHPWQVDDFDQIVTILIKGFSSWFWRVLTTVNGQALDYIAREAAMDAVRCRPLLLGKVIMKGLRCQCKGAAQAPSETVMVIDWNVLLLQFSSKFSTVKHDLSW